MNTPNKNGGVIKAPGEAAALPVLVKAPPLPVLPLVLVDERFIAHLDRLATKVEALKITNVAAAQSAANLLVEITDLGRQLDRNRAAAKRPFLDINSAIEAAARAPAGTLAQLKAGVQKHIAEWDADLRRRAEESERARQAEIARLKEEKRRQDEEAKRTAAELAASLPAGAAAAALDLDFEDDGIPAEPAPKSEIEKQIEALKYAPPAVSTAAPAGVQYRSRLLFTVTDIAKLPEQFITRSANEKLIREVFVVGFKDGDPLPSLPGVEFKVDRVPVSTGRAPALF
ncbi:MAG: hypothetical protein LBC18_00345 [Opitutaceae bacterium]|jgi:hypothetical protein|nr:hypothetical protein [Opitutaceae bacterium]